MTYKQIADTVDDVVGEICKQLGTDFSRKVHGDNSYAKTEWWKALVKIDPIVRDLYPQGYKLFAVELQEAHEGFEEIENDRGYNNGPLAPRKEGSIWVRVYAGETPGTNRSVTIRDVDAMNAREFEDKFIKAINVPVLERAIQARERKILRRQALAIARNRETA